MNIFMRFPEGRAKALTLSYDDGVEQDKQLMSVLDAYGIKCTFNLNGKYFEKDIRTYEPDRLHRPMGKIDAVELYRSAFERGHEVAVHSYSHPFLDQLPLPLAVYDVVRDRARLEELFGGVIRGAAYPYGTYNDGAVEAMRSVGIKYARTIAATGKFDLPSDWLRLCPTCHHGSPELFDLADAFLAEKVERAPKMFYLWGHSFEFEKNGNWDVIENFCRKTGGRDDVWYASNVAIYDYVKAYERLEFSLDGGTVYNPSAAKVWFEIAGEVKSVDAGQTAKLN